ncbi:Precorrin-6A reductase [Geobacillus sp. BCO2]|nr:Precorrin-6A reductase [Geobacillus sp. BCO2]
MILMLAGTSDARELAVMIQQAGYSVTATVVTDHAAEQLRSSGIRAYVGRMDASQLAELAKAEGAKAIVDASHPFAEEASKNAMQAAAVAGLPYIRYERQASSLSFEKVTFVDSYEEAAELAAKKGGVVMLTTGSKTLDIFAAKLLNRPNVKVIARMLPRKDNLDKCERLGFSQEQIVMMQGRLPKSSTGRCTAISASRSSSRKKAAKLGLWMRKSPPPRSSASRSSSSAARGCHTASCTTILPACLSR